jgi:hypothetical protein
MKRIEKFVLLCQIISALATIGFLTIGFFGVPLGIDKEPGWDAGKIAAISMGFACLLLLVYLSFYKAILKFLRRPIMQLTGSAWWQKGIAFFSKKLVKPYPEAPGKRLLADRWQIAILVSITLLLVLFCYWFFITSGKLVQFPPYSQYFDRLADALLAGQLHLLEEPHPALGELDNPYDFRNREGFSYLWDASYHQGRYYLYWGPVPAMVAALAKLITPMVVEDQYLVFLFLSGHAIVFAILLATLRKHWFPTTPKWSVSLFIVMACLSTPLFWLINRPHVYEAAIASGQFFLITGLLFMILSMKSTSWKAVWLMLTGFCWGAAINARFSLLLAVAMLSLLFAIMVIAQQGWKAGWRILVWLLLPLGLWAGFTAAYNFFRFGSVLETGHRYQLTGMAYPPRYEDVTSWRYILPNFYSYVLRPLEFDPQVFPFYNAPYLTWRMWPFYVRLPAHYYYAEPVAGLIPLMPASLALLLPLWTLWRYALDWLHEKADPIRIDKISSKTWLFVFGFGGVISLFAPILVFVSSSMRYLADVSSIATLAGCLGFWWLYERWDNKLALRTFLIVTMVGLIVYGVVISILVNFTNGDRRFLTHNPALYTLIRQLLMP